MPQIDENITLVLAPKDPEKIVVWYVDDEIREPHRLLFVRSVAKALAPLGVGFKTFETPFHAAVEAIDFPDTPIVVITDNNMPGMTGVEFLGAMRQYSRLSPEGSIIFSGLSDQISDCPSDVFICDKLKPKDAVNKVVEIVQRMQAVAPNPTLPPAPAPPSNPQDHKL